MGNIKANFFKNTGFQPSIEDYVFEVDTTKAGSASNTFVLPLHSQSTTSVNCTIWWGDGTSSTLIWNSGLSIYEGDTQHVYDVSGIYIITIQGTFNVCWTFNNAGDRRKLLRILQFGSTKRMFATNTSSAVMMGCSNLSLSDVTDALIITGNTVMTNRFNGCSSITNIPHLEDWSTEYWGGSWGLNNMFAGCTNLDEDFGKWKWNGFTGNSALTFMDGVTLSVANYNSTLLSILAQKAVLSTSEQIGFGNSVHSKTEIESGTTDSTLANKLIDSTQNFLSTVSVGDAVKNKTIGTTTTSSPSDFCLVVSVDSDTQLTLNADIFVSGQNYKIFSDSVTKAKADVISTKLWSIKDGTPY